MNKDKLIELINSKKTTREIGIELNISQTAVRYWLKKFDLKTCSEYYKRWDIVKLKDFIVESTCPTDVIRKMGLDSKFCGNYSTLKRKIKEHKIDTSHFKKVYRGNRFKQTIKNEDIFKEDSLYCASGFVKRRIIKENLIEYICSSCSNDGFWENKPLTLQLDHKNGNNFDNRLINLHFLCPNCHSQTETFSKKKKK
jgi:5-methylcytosine-specific restriction endonuclease McrA